MILRTLGKVGAEVTAFCTSKRNVGYHSRYGKKICYHDIEELKKYVEIIVEKAVEKPLRWMNIQKGYKSKIGEWKLEAFE